VGRTTAGPRVLALPFDRRPAQAAAQLPAELKRLWTSDERPARRPLKLHRREFYDRVKRAADLRTLHKAEVATDAVFAVLKKQLSPGEADDILTQLPRDLKYVWVHAFEAGGLRDRSRALPSMSRDSPALASGGRGHHGPVQHVFAVSTPL
jgi:hypothetical protein